MNRTNHFCAAALVFVILLAASIPGLADDSAASIAVGGLVARRETRIVMAKEVLQLGLKKIVVDYDFRNDTDEDVTTEVAFPVPDYDYTPASMYGVQEASFADFQLFIDGKPKVFEKEAKASFSGKDVTGILLADHIDVATLGHLKEVPGRDAHTEIPDFTRLPEHERKRLVAMGLFNGDSGMLNANWTVHLQFHWTQTFPAHSTTHIRHEYTPAEGFQYVQVEAFKTVLSAGKNLKSNPLTSGRPQDDKDLLASFCADPSFLRPMIQSLSQQEPQDGGYTGAEWVDFILTTANTWKQPIEDFTLIVERSTRVDGYGKPMKNLRTLVSFCSPQNGNVEKLDADHFQVHLTNFIPKSELHIGFFDLPAAKPAPKK